jgi:hypothetical protein
MPRLEPDANDPVYRNRALKRLMAKVEMVAAPPDAKLDTPCWLWKGGKTGGKYGGYGSFSFLGKSDYAHRAAYRLIKGEIPKGLETDHLCRRRHCCNPDHLEPVTSARNKHRSPLFLGGKTHCNRGHSLVGSNVYWTSRGWTSRGRVCRTCELERQKTLSKKRAELAGREYQARSARKTHCPQGHPYEGSNLHFDPRGYRRCRACWHEHYVRSKQSALR